MAGLTEADVRRIVREELRAILGGRLPTDGLAPVVVPLRRPFAALEATDQSYVRDCLAAGRMPDAESILRSRNATCSPDDLEPRERAGIRALACTGTSLPVSPHLPGWADYVATWRPIARTDDLTAKEAAIRDQALGCAEKLSGSPPPHYGAEEAANYHRVIAAALSRLLVQWRFILTPADIPLHVRGVRAAIAGGYLTTGPHLPAADWQTTMEAA